MVVESSGRRPLILDLGTGLRFFGLTQPRDGSFDGVALVSHLHWDHVQGLPFFTPVLAPGARLEVYGPRQDDGKDLAEAVRTFMAPPYFPVSIDALPGSFTFTPVWDGEMVVDGYEIQVRPVPHVGPTVGYRIGLGGSSVAYVSDHQQPGCGATAVAESVLELCDGVDLLIHDAQFNDAEFAMKHDWGHCTIDYAVNVAAQAGAKRLVLFHHDPAHHDDEVDSLLRHAASLGSRSGVDEVIAASEGLSISLSHAVAR